MAGWGWIWIYIRLKTSKPPTDSPQQEPMTSHGLLALVTSTKLHNSEGALRDSTKKCHYFSLSWSISQQNTLKKRTHSTFNHSDLRGVKLFRCGRCTKTGEIEFFRPPLLPLLQLPTRLGPVQKMAERSIAKRRLGWGRNQNGGQLAASRTCPSLESGSFGLKYMILMYRKSYF